MPRIYPPLLERFWQKVDKNGPIPAHAQSLGPCWVWIANTNRKGYGRFAVLYGCIVMPHRFSFALHYGETPYGLEIDHLCRNKLCVNPKHLEAVTGLVNHGRARQFRTYPTHCKRGHPLSGENLYIGTGNRRVCRQCHSQKSNEAAERRRIDFYSKGLTWDGKRRKTRTKPPIAIRQSASG